jgi:hypothetical protein
MRGNPREIITIAERRFPVRVRLGVPPDGFGRRHTEITAWFDENCAPTAGLMTPSGVRGVLNDAVSVYCLDALLADAFVARWSPGPGPRQKAACSGFATTSRRRGSGQGCIQPLEILRNSWLCHRNLITRVSLTRSIAASAK